MISTKTLGFPYQFNWILMNSTTFSHLYISTLPHFHNFLHLWAFQEFNLAHFAHFIFPHISHPLSPNLVGVIYFNCVEGARAVRVILRKWVRADSRPPRSPADHFCHEFRNARVANTRLPDQRKCITNDVVRDRNFPHRLLQLDNLLARKDRLDIVRKGRGGPPGNFELFVEVRVVDEDLEHETILLSFR